MKKKILIRKSAIFGVESIPSVQARKRWQKNEPRGVLLHVTGLDEPATYSFPSDEKGEAFHGEVKTRLNDDAYPGDGRYKRDNIRHNALIYKDIMFAF